MRNHGFTLIEMLIVFGILALLGAALMTSLGSGIEKADKGKTRVVWQNGMSLPNMGGSRVVAGSTIIVPLEPPPEGKTTIETIRDITGIVASLAMVWLVIENTK